MGLGSEKVAQRHAAGIDGAPAGMKGDERERVGANAAVDRAQTGPCMLDHHAEHRALICAARIVRTFRHMTKQVQMLLHGSVFRPLGC